MSELSRQRAWQLRKVADGRCPQCGREVIPNEKGVKRYRCDLCSDKANKGWREWHARRGQK